MASNYAYQYNDIFDDYFIQPGSSGNAAPKRYPNQAPNRTPNRRPDQQPQKKQQPPIHKYKKSKKQDILEKKRKFKIFLAKASVIFSCFAAMFIMLAVSQAELKNTVAELEAAEESYNLCLEQNNQLKYQLDEVMKKVDIEKIAQEQLGLVKVPENKQREINISLYQ